MTEQERMATEKVDFLKYFADVPIQKYAAMHIGRSDETITRWKRDDVEFVEQIKALRAEYLRKSVKKIRLGDPKWVIERMYKKDFSARQEITGADGERLLPVIIEELETDYEKYAKEISGQGVENETPVQNQEQAGADSTLRPQPDPATPHSGEAGEQAGTDPQG